MEWILVPDISRSIGRKLRWHGVSTIPYGEYVAFTSLEDFNRYLNIVGISMEDDLSCGLSPVGETDEILIFFKGDSCSTFTDDEESMEVQEDVAEEKVEEIFVPKVICMGSGLEGWRDGVNSVLLKWSLALKKVIYVSNPHGRVVNFLDIKTGVDADKLLHIAFYSCLPYPSYYDNPPSRVDVRVVNNVFNIELRGGQRDSLVPTPGHDYIWETNGEIVGSVDEMGNICVPFDLPHSARNFAIILDYVLCEYEKLFKDREGYRLRNFEVACRCFGKGFCDRHMEYVQSRLTAVDSEILSIESALVRLFREKRSLEKGSKQFMCQSTDFIAKIGKDLSSLMKIPEVLSLTISTNSFMFYIDDIYIKHNGFEYDLGKFRILISKDSINALSLSDRNSLGRVNAHPHVGSGGGLCLGNVSSSATKLLANSDYKHLALLIIDFLKSYNHEDSYCRISNWPSRPIGSNDLFTMPTDDSESADSHIEVESG
ncbi:MAG: hypothetical protein GY861_21320 [bacterium]|nr:hypothetical protein [bacterium]